MRLLRSKKNQICYMKSIHSVSVVRLNLEVEFGGGFWLDTCTVPLSYIVQGMYKLNYH